MGQTVVGVFDRFLLAEDAIQELEKAGYPRNAISIVAGDVNGESIRRTADEAAGIVAGTAGGAAVGGIAGLIVGLVAMAVPGVGPVLAAGPVAASLGITAAGAATGGLIGAFTGSNIPESDAEYYAEAVRRGSAVVLLKTDDESAARAREILQHAGAAEARPAGGETHPKLDEEAELEHSSEPKAPQTALSGARIYEDGLEMNPRKSTFQDFDECCRRDFESRFSESGYTYRQLAPAYRFGQELAGNELYRGKAWGAVESTAYRAWEEVNPNTWEQVKDAVRYGFTHNDR